MNDDFLYSLRKQPSREFSAQLKARLRSIGTQPSRRLSVVRGLFLGLLVGGSALAATLWAVHVSRVEQSKPIVSREVSSEPPSANRVRLAQPPADRSDSVNSFSEHSPQMMPTTRGSITNDPVRENGVGPKAVEANSVPQSAPLGGFALDRSSAATRSQRTLGPPAIRIAGPMSTLVFAQSVPRVAWNLEPEVAISDAAFARLCTEETTAKDVILTTRRITQQELQHCQGTRRRGPVLEAKLGYIAVVVSAPSTAIEMSLTPRDLYLALAKRIPDPNDPGAFIPNQSSNWRHVDSGFEDRTIAVYGPAPDSQLARFFEELVMEPGCDSFPALKAFKVSDPELYRRVCYELRDDAAYRPVYENEVFLTQTLWADPHAIAILSFRFFDEHRQQLSGSLLGKELPSLETIASGSYSSSAPVYVYSHGDSLRRTFGLQPFIGSLLTEHSLSRLAGAGLIPLPDSERPQSLQPLERVGDGGR